MLNSKLQFDVFEYLEIFLKDLKYCKFVKGQIQCISNLLELLGEKFWPSKKVLGPPAGVH